MWFMTPEMASAAADDWRASVAASADYPRRYECKSCDVSWHARPDSGAACWVCGQTPDPA